MIFAELVSNDIAADSLSHSERANSANQALRTAGDEIALAAIAEQLSQLECYFAAESDDYHDSTLVYLRTHSEVDDRVAKLAFSLDDLCEQLVNNALSDGSNERKSAAFEVAEALSGLGLWMRDRLNAVR